MEGNTYQKQADFALGAQRTGRSEQEPKGVFGANNIYAAILSKRRNNENIKSVKKKED